jgi:dipeptidyl-peptidase-4
MLRRQLIKALLLAGLSVGLSPGLRAGQVADPGLLTLERIFSSDEFAGEWFGGARWLDDGGAPAYTVLRPPADGKKGARHRAGRRRNRAAHRAGALPNCWSQRALPPAFGRGLRLVRRPAAALVFTNGQRVWRRNTRGDYWVLDLPTRKLTRLGGAEA